MSHPERDEIFVTIKVILDNNGKQQVCFEKKKNAPW
jgi:hypothetical protein